MVRIQHNLTLRPLNIVRHLVPDAVMKLLNVTLIISATLDTTQVCRVFERALAALAAERAVHSCTVPLCTRCDALCSQRPIPKPRPDRARPAHLRLVGGCQHLHAGLQPAVVEQDRECP
jgi:hypothetical protein